LDALLKRFDAHELVDDAAPHRACQLVVDLDPVRLPELVLAQPQLPLELGERNLFAVHLGRKGGPAHAEVDAPENEGDREQAQDDAGNPPADRIMNPLQHVPNQKDRRTDLPWLPRDKSVLDSYIWRSGRDSNPRPPA